MTDKTGRLEADDREPQVMGRVNRDVIGREGEAVAVLNSEGRKLPDGCPLYTYSPIADLLHERAELLAEVERLRGLVKHLEEQTDSQYDEAVTAKGSEVAR